MWLPIFPIRRSISLGEILERMRDRRNVRLHLVGHADNQPLSAATAEIYGDNAGLSRERAGQVAEHFQTALALPPEGISYEWAGDSQPVASNLTEEGRALNRRVEVEVWYDEIRERVDLEEFLVPHEITTVKVCRMETVCKLRYVDGHAKRARVQNLVAPLHYGSESIEVDPMFVERVRRRSTTSKTKTMSSSSSSATPTTSRCSDATHGSTAITRAVSCTGTSRCAGCAGRPVTADTGDRE